MYVHRSHQRIYHIVREHFVKKPSDKPDTRGFPAEIPKSKRKLFEVCKIHLVAANITSLLLNEDRTKYIVQVWYVCCIRIFIQEYVRCNTYTNTSVLISNASIYSSWQLHVPMLCHSPRPYRSFVGESLHVFSSSKRGIQKYLQSEILLNSINPVTDY